MPLEARSARRDRLFEPPRAPVLLGKRAEGYGRRILPDPAFQFVDAREHTASAGRRDYDPVTVIERVSEELFPWLSVTVRVTKYVPAAV